MKISKRLQNLPDQFSLALLKKLEKRWQKGMMSLI